VARVFLSYDREDTSQAKSVAVMLESAGHSVWWDRQIRGGAEFSEEIEKELEQAEAVLVLWSERSVRSAWVRDEAAAGRDSGRLVPLLLDRAKPPLGFRQYQNIDLSRWRSDAESEEASELLAAIDGLCGENTRSLKRAERSLGKKIALPATAIGAAVLILMVGAGAIVLMRGGGETGVQTVVVQAADGSAPNQSAAHDLLIRLTTLQTTNAGLMRLQGADPGAPARADLIFEAAASWRGCRRRHPDFLRGRKKIA
jgi:hypothetical protein